MLAKATITRHYRLRLGFFALIPLVMGAAFLYDGVYGYPRQREIFQAHLALQQKGLADQWPAFARARGWPEDADPQNRTDDDLIWQYAMAAVCLPFGLRYAWAFFRAPGRWIGVDDHALLTSDGRSIPLADVTALSDARWADKGIAIIKYRHASAAERRLVLDDWKYDRQSTLLIYDRVKAALNRT